MSSIGRAHHPISLLVLHGEQVSSDLCLPRRVFLGHTHLSILAIGFIKQRPGEEDRRSGLGYLVLFLFGFGLDSLVDPGISLGWSPLLLQRGLAFLRRVGHLPLLEPL